MLFFRDYCLDGCLYLLLLFLLLLLCLLLRNLSLNGLISLSKFLCDFIDGLCKFLLDNFIEFFDIL